MTARYFTPRDAALDLGRRTQLNRSLLASRSAGHSLEIVRAIRSLAAVRGADLSGRDPVSWEPPASSAPIGPAPSGAVPAFGSLIPPASVVAPLPPSAAIWSFGASRDPAMTASIVPGEPQPTLDPSKWPAKPKGGRLPMDEKPSAVLNPDGTVVRQPQPAGSESEPFPFPSIFFPQPPSSKPVPSPMPEPSMPPGNPRPDAGSCGPSGPAKKPTATSVQVLVEAIPKVLKQELQEIAGQARRELRDYRLVQGMRGCWPRR